MAGLVRDVLWAFWKNDGFFLAAGLSFYVVICIVPFVLLLIAGGGFLLSDETAVQDVVTRITEVLPFYRTDVEEILTRVAEARRISGLLGTAILLIFATQLFAATRLVLNRMVAAKGRGFLPGMLSDFGMIVVLTVLFFVSMGLTAGLAWIEGLLPLVRRGRLVVALVAWSWLFLAVALDTLMFALVYRLVPGRRIPWRSVAVGSVVTAALWEIAKQLFRLYIEGVGVYSAVYGSLGVTIALIMWVYYSAIVFVLGASLIRVLEDRRAAAGDDIAV